MTTRIIACGAAWAAAVVAAVVLWPEPAYTHKPTSTNIFFKNEIAQIFQRKCFQCHSENNVSFSLTTYTEARPWARAIREEILDREMPPWQAVPGYGHFANDISLTSREKEIILSWADGGAPSGVVKAEESIPPVYVPPSPEWSHGEPDLVLPLGTGEPIPAYAPFTIKRIVVDTRLPRPRRVHAIALKQGDRRVVRHAAFYDEATGNWLGAWTAWQTASDLGGRAAFELPARARIAVEIGYQGTDADVTDTSELGLYFASGDGAAIDARSLASEATTLAAGSEGHRVRVETTLASDTTVLALLPDPGPAGRSVEITAITPDGMAQPLLWIQQYRHEWRSPYVLSSPLVLPRKTRLVMTTYFDNPGSDAATVRARAWMLTEASRPASARRR